MPPAILTERLIAKYGHRLGIENLDLEVRSDEVFGFIGPNGAGKTTTIRLLLDLLHPTSGRATVLGLDAYRESAAVRRSIGYLPGEFGLDVRMTGRQLIRYYSRLRGSRILSLLYHLGRPLEGDFPWTAVLLMLVGVCALTGAAMGAFARRDIYT